MWSTLESCSWGERIHHIENGRAGVPDFKGDLAEPFVGPCRDFLWKYSETLEDQCVHRYF